MTVRWAEDEPPHLSRKRKAEDDHEDLRQVRCYIGLSMLRVSSCAALLLIIKSAQSGGGPGGPCARWARISSLPHWVDFSWQRHGLADAAAAPIRCTMLLRPPLMRSCTPFPHGAAALSAGAHTNPQHASKMPGGGVPRPRPGIIRRAQPLLTCQAPPFVLLGIPLGSCLGWGCPPQRLRTLLTLLACSAVAIPTALHRQDHALHPRGRHPRAAQPLRHRGAHQHVQAHARRGVPQGESCCACCCASHRLLWGVDQAWSRPPCLVRCTTRVSSLSIWVEETCAWQPTNRMTWHGMCMATQGMAWQVHGMACAWQHMPCCGMAMHGMA